MSILILDVWNGVNIFVFLETAHQVYCIIRVKEGTSLTGRFQSGPIKVSRFESSKSFPTYHQLLIAFNNFHRGQLCIDPFICSSFASPPTNFVDAVLLVHHKAYICCYNLGVASRTLFFSLQGRSCLGNSFQITFSPHSAKYMNI